MNIKLLKLLEEQIDKIEELKTIKPSGPEYKIWKNTSFKVVQDLFGEEYLNLFKNTLRVNVISMSTLQNRKRHIERLENAKGLLVGFIAERKRLENISSINIGKTIGLSDYDLHPSIKEVSKKRFEDGNYSDAVVSAFKEVIKRVKEHIEEKVGEELDGDKAMNRAFGFEKKEPIVQFNNLQTKEEKDEQRGIMFLFKGIVGIRNRKSHENVILDDPHKAIEYLALASLLMRLLDEYIK